MIDKKYIKKWILYHIGWSDDYCLKHRRDKTPHGFHNDRWTCPICELNKQGRDAIAATLKSIDGWCYTKGGHNGRVSR